MRYTVYLIDDHPVVRKGLKALLEGNNEFSVIGDSDDESNYLHQIHIEKPDLLLLDISIGHRSGLDLIQPLKVASPETKIVILTMHNDPLYAKRAQKEGASGFVPKDLDTKLLFMGLRKVLGQTGFVDMSTSTREDKSKSELSVREIEVLKFTAQGMNSKEIAEHLQISARTVEVHRANIQKKLGTSNAAESVARAKMLGWI